MIRHTNRTHTYLGTVANDTIGLCELAELRQGMKVSNAGERLTALLSPSYVPQIKRVVAFGRLGKNNPNSTKYKENYQYIAKSDAATLDLYIHPAY